MKPHPTGAVADYLLVTANRIAPRPTQLNAVDAASLVVTGTTALRALQDIAKVRAGEQVLIRGAAGGVGLAAVQIAVALQATVTTLSSGKDIDTLRDLGVTHPRDYRQSTPGDLGDYDVIFDTVGTQLMTYRRHLTRSGRMVTIAFTSATAFAEIAASSIHGPRRIRAFSSDAKRDLLERLSTLVTAGTLRPHVADTFGMNDIAAAHLAQQTGGQLGKQVISMGAGDCC
jgi:NADPH:quinone reductase-like Zn-dependent oxidoreductase